MPLMTENEANDEKLRKTKETNNNMPKWPTRTQGPPTGVRRPLEATAHPCRRTMEVQGGARRTMEGTHQRR